jgi:hypothetical protein
MNRLMSSRGRRQAALTGDAAGLPRRPRAERPARHDEGEQFYMADVVERCSHAANWRACATSTRPTGASCCNLSVVAATPWPSTGAGLSFSACATAASRRGECVAGWGANPSPLPVAALLKLGLLAGTRWRVMDKLTDGRPAARQAAPLWPDL